jgi:hypothetical protein
MAMDTAMTKVIGAGLRRTLAPVLICVVPATAVDEWPPIAPTSASVFFASGQDANFALQIKSAANGSTLYVLECHTFTFEDPDFNYSGDFECRLRTVAGDAGPLGTLLADRKSEREWDTRGRFLREEVEGDCARYPDYGVQRRFRLRGMSLTIALSDLTLAPRKASPHGSERVAPAFRSFRMTVEVNRDDAATSDIAAVPATKNPLQPGRSPGTFRRDCRPATSAP